MTLKFLHKKHEVGTIYSFFFESIEQIEWIAGQYLNLTMPDVAPVYSDRIFTIASAPHENHLMITTWITESPFKKQLMQLNPGNEVLADQLGGDFYWEDDGREKLYLVGGIGITPFRSILLDRVHNQLPNNAVLMWSGKKDGRPFVGEINDLLHYDSTLRIHHYIDERINVKKIQTAVPDFNERTIYLAGSQPFVDGLGEALMATGIPRTQLKYDWFDGYTEDIQ